MKIPIIAPVETEEFACRNPQDPVCRHGMTPQDCATLGERIGWLVNLRWLVTAAAAAGLAVGAVFFRTIAFWPGLACVVAALGIFNAFWQRRLRENRTTACQGALEFTSNQILADFVLLTLAVHMTGGLTGPLTPLYILHGVFSAVLLPERNTVRIMGIAVLLMAISLTLQTTGICNPVWLLDYRHEEFNWLARTLEIGFLFIATFGSIATGLGLSATLRKRHTKIAVLAKELEKRNATLRKVDEQRVRLLGAASHDLKSPISVLEMKLDLFLDGYLGDLSEKQKDEMRKMKERMVSLRYFINDMLDLTAIEHKGVSSDERKPVDVVAQLKTALSDQEIAARTAGLLLEQSLPEGPLIVSAAPAPLARAWQNLIGNAVKYGAGGKTVEVSCRAEGNDVLVTVADHGIGISAEDQAKLFTDFFRAGDAVAKGIPGTGLGLSIVKRIVEAADGTISVRSEPGKGSSFTVRLPLAKG